LQRDKIAAVLLLMSKTQTYRHGAMINRVIKIFLKEFMESEGTLPAKDANFLISGILFPPVSKVKP